MTKASVVVFANNPNLSSYSHRDVANALWQSDEVNVYSVYNKSAFLKTVEVFLPELIVLEAGAIQAGHVPASVVGEFINSHLKFYTQRLPTVIVIARDSQSFEQLAVLDTCEVVTSLNLADVVMGKLIAAGIVTKGARAA
jgi:hypothetical protein